MSILRGFLFESVVFADYLKVWIEIHVFKNNKMDNSIHIGSLIKREVKKTGMPVGDFAKALNCDVSNVYKIYKKENIDLIQLQKIAKILNSNFAADLFKIKKHIVVLETTSIEKIEELQKDQKLKILHIS